jgi:hypothetical protein
MDKNLELRIHKFISIILWTTLSIALFGGGYSFYENRKKEKEYELRHTKITSPKLEKAKFVDLKFNTNINSYKGFKLLNPYSGNDFYDESIGEQAYGYFGDDTKYNSVGSFYLSNPILEAEEAEVKLSPKQIANASNIKLTVYTFNKKIYKIKFVIKEYSDSNFNELLKAAYGPSSLDNGYNDINYFSDDEINWESPNILLTTYGETKPTYYKGRLSMVPDKRRYITYLSKSLKAMLDSTQNAKSARSTEDGINKL